MNALLSLFKKQNASSAELRALEIDLQKELEAADLRLSELERLRRTLLIEGTPKQLSELDDEMASSRLIAERAAVMTEDLQPRIRAAEQAENAREVEARAALGMKLNRDLRDLYLSVDATLMTFVSQCADAQRLRKEISDINKFVSDNGRRDLKINSLFGMLGQLMGREPSAIPDPTLGPDPLSSIRSTGIAGYIPMHPDGRLIARLKELKLP